MKRITRIGFILLVLVSVSLVSCETTGSNGMSNKGSGATYRTTERMMDDIMVMGPSSMGGPRF